MRIPKINTDNMLQYSIHIGDNLTGKQVTTLAGFDPLQGRYVAKSVLMEAPINQINYKNIKLPVRRLLAENLRPLVADNNPDLVNNHPNVKTWAENRKGRKMARNKQINPTVNLLEEAALIMDLERTVGGFPVRTLTRVMGIDYKYAKKWADKIRRMR